ncbi:sigma-70 family RNA polymerase sigma factor [Nocardioides sp. zg-DK7169]|uniref:sigma-70 family RNA polymerase sigma factor n=1 Tax=Nocardioides sp. zg-DK7169 TaxID=2736600 RepID=UPI001557656B|nr:sigma-70 family RNA polymerase sigma factor [Nocardioides sp. zg-DK7169]NPC99032.1 sigma-70 family RNA polymerase sigma factor [Nocardioides sp. zg-DK7169]
MRSPDEFDAFYTDARQRLLLQTYALTGDLPAARAAVRDAFVIAWHHWRKAESDPEAWTRPQAWAHALRRHSARPWHKEKTEDPEVRATLDALDTLSIDERRILLLTLLADGTPDEFAREIGVTRQVADGLLQSATTRLAAASGVPPAQVGQLMAPLERAVAGTRFPRTTIVRRSGITRRRLHTAAGVLGTVAVLVVGGIAVSSTDGVRPGLDRGGDGGSVVSDEPPAPRLEASDMLTTGDFDKLLPARGWSGGTPNANADGDGAALPCQLQRYADPNSSTYLVKDFRAKTKPGNPRRTATQTVEGSDQDRAAERAYRTTLGWFAGCTQGRTQLVSTHRVRDVGDQAMLLVLRDWDGPVTIAASVARTGRFTTALVTTATTDAGPSIRDNAALLARAVDKVCRLPEAGECAVKRPEVRTVDPVAVGIVPAMLSEVDLPPVGRVSQPWVGTAPREVRQNFAATRCDEATFRGKGWTDSTTRTFVVPGARLPASFGLTQTIGALPAAQARDFVATIRSRMQSCPERFPGTEVDLVLNRSKGQIDLSVWKVTVEIDDNTSVRYLMALARRGGALSQIGFVPAPDVQMSDSTFVALAERSLSRLGRLPVPGS